MASQESDSADILDSLLDDTLALSSDSAKGTRKTGEAMKGSRLSNMPQATQGSRPVATFVPLSGQSGPKSNSKTKSSAAPDVEPLAGPSSSPAIDVNSFTALQQTVATMSQTFSKFNKFIDLMMDSDSPPDGIGNDGFDVDGDVSDGEIIEDAKDQQSDPGQHTSATNVFNELSTYYDSGEAVSANVEPKLASILEKLAHSRLPEEKLKEKMGLYLRPDNCESLVLTKVNQEIWDKLQTPTRSRDLKFQKIQSSMVKGMIAVTQAADALAKNEISKDAILRKLVDSLALFTHSTHELNQRRREDCQSDLNYEFKELCSSSDTATSNDLLFGSDLPNRIKQIADTNRVSNRISGRGQSSYKSRRFQPYSTPASRQSWIRNKFRQSFLGGGPNKQPYWQQRRGNASRQRRGQRAQRPAPHRM